MGAQMFNFGRCAGVVSDQALLAGNHRGFLDGWVLAQAGLDLPQFDAQATDLDLIIIASQVFDSTVRQIAAQVTGAVHAPRHERVIEETLGGEIGTVQVTPRHLHTGDKQFTHYPQRHWLQLPVQHVQAGVGNRLADGRVVRHVRACAGPRGHVHRCFSGTIQVVQTDARQLLLEAPHQAARQGFAAAHHAHQPGRLADIAMGKEHIEH